MRDVFWMAGIVQADQVRLEERSRATCSVASWQGQLYLAWTGSDGRLNLMVATDGFRFGDKRTLSERSVRTEGSGENSSTIPMGPALAASDDFGLHMTWTGTDRWLNVMRLDRPDMPKVIVDQRSSDAPALAIRGTDLVLAWTGSDRQLNLVASQNGFATPPLLLGERSSHSPAVAAWGSSLLVVWAGSDRQLNLIHDLGGTFCPPRFSGDTTNRNPALCVQGDERVMVWRDPNRWLFARSVSRESWGTVTPIEATSSVGPAICVHRGQLVLAWTATDHHINLAYLRRM